MQRIVTKREKIILLVTVGVIIFSLAFNLFIDPALTKNQNLNREIELTRAKLRKYLQLLAQKEVIQNEYRKFPTSSRQEEGGDIFVNALAEIDNLAKTCNIRIIDIRPQNPRSANLAKEALIDLRAEGNMEGYLRFLYNLENSLLLFKIKSLRLNAKPNSQDLEGILSLSQLVLD